VDIFTPLELYLPISNSNHDVLSSQTSTKHDIWGYQRVDMKSTAFWDVAVFYPEDGGSRQ
jgi:hypothetical protein